MADRKKDKEIDEMLDSLLASYSSVEPRPGLQTRIIATLRDSANRGTSHGWWNFKWLWAAVVVAAIIIAAMLINGRRRIEPPTHVIVQTIPAIPKPEIQPHAPVKHSVTAGIHRRKPSTVPTSLQNATLALNERPAVFPTPAPLSEQEKLLLSYLAGTPREEVVAQSHPDEPPVVGDQDQTEAMPDLMHIQKFSNTR
jgi:hypothetical protein